MKDTTDNPQAEQERMMKFNTVSSNALRIWFNKAAEQGITLNGVQCNEGTEVSSHTLQPFYNFTLFGAVPHHRISLLTAPSAVLYSCSVTIHAGFVVLHM